MMQRTKVIVLVSFLTFTSGCLPIATSYTDRSYPTHTGHIREQIEGGTISLHFEAVSVLVRMGEEAPSKTENLWIGVVPVPLSTGETDRIRSQRNARIRFWICIKPNGSGVEYAPMKTTLKKGEDQEVYPIGYLKEYDWLYSDIYTLTTASDKIACSSNTEINVVYEVAYDSQASYQLRVDGLTKDGIPVHVPAIKFVPKRVSHIRS